MDKQKIAEELLRRGVSPDAIAAAGYGQTAQQGRTGLIAPSLGAPDAVAARGAYLRDYGKLSERREQLGRHAPNMANLDRFQQINRLQPTGGIQHQDFFGLNLIQSINEAINPRLKELSGIASTLQGQARPEGSGATSDFEQRLYRMGVPSPEKLGKVNDNIIRYQKGVIAEERDRTAFDDEFIRRNGSLSGSAEAWERYITAHPYIMTDRNGRTVLNDRRPDWRQYFGLEQSRASGNRPGAGNSPVTAAARNAHSRLKQTGAITGRGAFGTAQNPYIATSPQMLQRLPKGSYVIDPDGNFGVIE